jgi:hypothetical protein
MEKLRFMNFDDNYGRSGEFGNRMQKEVSLLRELHAYKAKKANMKKRSKQAS